MDYVIKTENLGRRFRRKWAVRDLCLEVPRGSAFGFLGRNGAGKTTTIRMLMGFLKPTTGTSEVLGINSWRHSLEVRRRVGYVPEMPVFYDWMTVGQTIGLVAHYRKERWDWRVAETLLEQFALDEHQKVKHLSKGMRAKLSLLLALAFKPEVLILDEPTFGLDPIARREFIQSILGVYQESGNTIFISSHLIIEIAGLVDYIGIIDEGKLLLSKPCDELLAKIKQIKLVFAEAVPEKITCTGMLRFTSSGHEALVSVEDFHPEKTIAELKRFNPQHIEVKDLNLEDVFIELVKGKTL